MANPYGLKDNYVGETPETQGTPVSASDLVARARVFASQVNKTVQSLGSGVMRVPNDNSLKVLQGSSLNATVSIGLGVAIHPTYGGIVIEIATPTPVTGIVDDSSENYVFAAIEVISTNDTRQTGKPKIIVSDSDVYSGGLPLAQIITAGGIITSVVDLRDFTRLDNLEISLAQVQAAITAIQNDIGGTYDEVALGTIKDRLAALESGGGGGGGGGTGTVYWGNLLQAFGNSNTISQFVDSEFAQHITDYHSQSAPSSPVLVIEESRDEIAVNGLLSLFLHEVAHDNAFVIAPLNRALIISPGRGKNKLGDPGDMIDRDASDIPLDELNHLIG